MCFHSEALSTNLINSKMAATAKKNFKHENGNLSVSFADYNLKFCEVVAESHHTLSHIQ